MCAPYDTLYSTDMYMSIYASTALIISKYSGDSNEIVREYSKRR